MRLLVLGGTQFLSRAIAADAVARGHDVTCAARGVSGAVPTGARHVPLDRAAPDWSGLEGEWDALVDVARTPSWVAGALDHLADRVTHWTFISSISAYADQSTPGGTPETLPLLDPITEDVEQDTPETYGAQKVACEQDVLARAPATARGPARADHRAGRPQRPVHLLGGAARGGRRGARSRVARPRHPGDRRTRPGGVGGHLRRASAAPGCTTPPGRPCASATSSTRSSRPSAVRRPRSGPRPTSCSSARSPTGPARGPCRSGCRRTRAA